MSNDITIFTHRGLETGKTEFFESSYEAFEDHLARGYGIEFDVNFTSDSEIVILHDKNLKRITNGVNTQEIFELTLGEVKKVPLGSNRVATFEELTNLIVKYNANLNALHLKGGFQQDNFIKILIDELKSQPEMVSRCVIFDVSIKTAQAILSEIPDAILAPSVAHDFDIQRYNSCVYETLLSVDQVKANKDLFKWVWLDEWDLTGPNNSSKKFYTKEVFEDLKAEGLKISLVTPELHATSPGLLGGESHPDAKNQELLFARIKEIIELGPDAICTDYPEQARSFIKGS